MNVTIYKNGEAINRIVADEAFAQAYCEENGCTYEVEAEEKEPAYTADDLFSVLLGRKEEIST